MKSGAHRSSAERDTLLRCDILQMTRVKNDPTRGEEEEERGRKEEDKSLGTGRGVEEEKKGQENGRRGGKKK